MTYRIVIAPPARRALETNLPDAAAAAAWEFIRGPLADDPFRVGRPLRGELTGKWSTRRGEYRVVYTIQAHVVTVTVVRIAHRRDAYREARRWRGSSTPTERTPPPARYPPPGHPPHGAAQRGSPE